MISILNILSWVSLWFVPVHSELLVKSYDLSNIFGDTIVFNDLCDQSLKSSFGSQFVIDHSSNKRYFNYERIYSRFGNDVSVKFHFSDEEERLWASVWEKYLINDNLVPSENMFFAVNVNYLGEDYTNAKLFRRSPFEYNVISDMEMSRIHYDIRDQDTCKRYTKMLEIKANFNGVIWNKAGTRSIYLDDMVLKFQVATLDTTDVPHAVKGTVFKPELKHEDPVKDFVELSESFENVFVTAWHEIEGAKWKGKPFMAFDKRSKMIFRLPEPHFSETLHMQGNRYFNPLGTEKPMNEWVQVHAAYKKDWSRLAKIAADYIKR